jgi:NADPH:quinone reductase-like Zn-dependent oxidoreductase
VPPSPEAATRALSGPDFGAPIGDRYCSSPATPHGPAELASAAELFALIEQGRLAVSIGGRYPLAEAAGLHADFESRGTTGKLLLLP